MLTLTFPLSVPQLLWIVLLVTSLSTQNGKWDNPTCTEGVVSVPRGERAVMGCNISNPFLSVAVALGTPGASVQPLFRVRSPGCFCREGWRLRVQGGVAQLVIDNASDSQAGCYKWHLQGLQRNIGVTTLNVSGAETPCPPEAGDPLTVVLVVSSIIVCLLFLVLGVLACTKGTGPLRYFPQKC